jgi:hypothetical protein
MADRAEAGMAAGQGRQAIDGISRRRVLRGGLLAGAGVVTAGAMSAVLTGTARAATPEPQPGWAWCEYCATMFWAADESTSWCASPSHIQHSYRKGAYNYELYNSLGGLNNNSNPQPYWRYCDYCQGLFWGPSGRQYCLGNLGPHVAGSGTSYDLYIGYGGQEYWRWCGNCALLFWADSSAANAQAGYCPANYSHHVAGSGTNYCVAWAGTF